jgi:hypothetical protein
MVRESFREEQERGKVTERGERGGRERDRRERGRESEREGERES